MARASVNVNTNRKERERMTTSPNKPTRTPTKETENANEPLSTLALETVLRERLLEITNPCRQVWVCVCVGEPDPTQRREREGTSDTSQTRVDGQWNSLVDVRLRGEIVWIASSVDILRSLVHPHVVDRHDRRKGQVFEIDRSEVGRNPQVDDHILGIRETPNR